MDRAFPRRGVRLGTLTTVLIVVLLASACSKKAATNGGTPTATGSVAIVKDDTIAAEVPADIASKGALVIAVDASYAPNEFFAADNTTLQGWDIDLGHAIGTVLGIQFNFENASFDTIIPGLASGKYDIGMSSFTDNTDREKTVDFVTYFIAGTSFYVNSSTGPDIKTLDDLCGHSVAVEKGTTQLDDATAQDSTCKTAGKAGVNVLAFPDQNGANLALSSGRAEVGMADSPVAAYQVQLSNGTFKLSGDAYSVAPYGIAIPRPEGAAPGTGPMSKPILDALNKLISTGAYLQILTQWGVQAGAITSPVINGAAG